MAFDGPSVQGALWLYAVSRALAAGPKLFRATPEQCEALEHVDLSLSVGQYRQPFSTMFVEFPSEYRKSVDARTGGLPRCPRAVIVQYWPEGVVATTAQILDGDGRPSEMGYLFVSGSADKTLESIVVRGSLLADCHYVLLNALTRVAMNLGLMLATRSSRLVPSDQAWLAKATKTVQKKKGPASLPAQIASHVHLIVPDSPVVVRDTRRERPEAPAGGPASSPKPHWRRGHFRAKSGFAEARGRGEQVPLVFVRPCLVNPDPAGPVPGAAYVVR